MFVCAQISMSAVRSPPSAPTVSASTKLAASGASVPLDSATTTSCSSAKVTGQLGQQPGGCWGLPAWHWHLPSSWGITGRAVCSHGWSLHVLSLLEIFYIFHINSWTKIGGFHSYSCLVFPSSVCGVFWLEKGCKCEYFKVFEL